MKLVLADLNFDALVEKTKELDVPVDRVLLCQVDVSKEEDIESLANAAFDTFGGVHLLFNNAGVAHAQLSWEHTADGMCAALFTNHSRLPLSIFKSNHVFSLKTSL